MKHYRIADPEWIRARLPRIPVNANKFTRGRLFLAAGSAGMAGAAMMAAQAALRTGCGYLDIAIPMEIYPIVTAAVPEAVCTIYDPSDPDSAKEILLSAAGKADAAVLGPGLGKNRETVGNILLFGCDSPMLIDADGLNFLAGSAEGFRLLSKDAVLTPHEGEAARLLGTESRSIGADRDGSLIKLTDRYRAAVLLKGPETLIASPGEETFVNHTGNAGMARAGSGDVLSGIIGSLMAQGMSGYEAAVSGAYIHGLAGDRCRESYGIRSYTPRDMIGEIAAVLKEIEEA